MENNMKLPMAISPDAEVPQSKRLIYKEELRAISHFRNLFRQHI